MKGYHPADIASLADELCIPLAYYLSTRAKVSSAHPLVEPSSVPPTEPREVEEGAEDDSRIRWTPVCRGFLAARAAPRDKAELESWKASAVVTLVQPSTRPWETVKSGCEELHILWFSAPLEPISKAAKPLAEDDWESFRQVDDVLQALMLGSRVVVHCAAGCHRTGIFCYVLLRSAGKSSEEALAAIRETREVTWQELTMIARKRPQGLIPKAEAIFQTLSRGKTT